MRFANCALVLFVSVSQFALAQAAPNSDPAADRTQIENSISEISKAYLLRDPGPFERLYLEHHAAIRGRPIFNLREQLIAMMSADSIVLRAGKRLDYQSLRYENKPPEIYLYGQTAIVTVTKDHYWQYHGQKCLTRTQGTELWVKEEGEWKFAASHTNTFDCDPKPFYPIHPAVAALQSRTRPPANTDTQAERQVRDVIQAFAAAKALSTEAFEAVLARYVPDTFVSTDPAGKVAADRALLATIRVPLPSRSSAFRNQDDVIIIYDDAAIYTFKVRGGVGPAADVIQQVTVFFAKQGGRWTIVAAHASRDD